MDGCLRMASLSLLLILFLGGGNGGSVVESPRHPRVFEAADGKYSDAGSIDEAGEAGSASGGNASLVMPDLTPEYWAQLLRASCTAKCYYAGSDVELPRLDSENEFLTNPAKCLEPKCFQCLQCVQKMDPCSACFSQGNPLIEPYRWNHGSLEREIENRIQSQNSGDLYSPLPGAGPIFHCSQWNRNDSQFTAYYRWELENHPERLRNLTEQEPDAVPRVFMVETELNGNGTWIPFPEPVTSWLIPVTVPSNVTFRVRITPVSPTKIYYPKTTGTLMLSDNEQRAVGEPKWIRIVRVRQNPGVDYADLQFLLHWASGGRESTTTCKAVVWVLEDQDIAVERHHANESFWIHITSQITRKPLRFGREHKVQIMEKSDVREAYSDSAIYKFRLPPCLQFFQRDFRMCPPPPPSNLSFYNVSSNDSLPRITWAAPEFTNATNRIESYQLNVSSLTQFSSPGKPPVYYHEKVILGPLTVPGNGTELILTDFNHTGPIQLSIRAKSRGGFSDVSLTDLLPPPKEEVAESMTHEEVWGAVGIALLLLFLFLACGFKLYFQRPGARDKGSEKEIQELMHMLGRREFAWSDWLSDPDDPNRILEQKDLGRILEEKDLDLGPIKGCGNFGVVHMASLVRDGKRQTVAVKFLKVGADPDEAEKLKEEYQILARLDPHPYVMRLIGIVKMDQNPYPGIVVEYCNEGDLRGYLQRLGKSFRGTRAEAEFRTVSVAGSRPEMDKGFPGYFELESTDGPVPQGPGARIQMVTNAAYFSEEDSVRNRPGRPELRELSMVLLFALQIAQAMEHLSRNHIIHRDLAARNILVSREGSSEVLKIADFGLSRDVYEKSVYLKMTKGKVPFKWMAIECLDKHVYTTKSDVWSYGVLLWEMVTFGGNPYPGIENLDILNYLGQGYRLSRPDNCPNALYHMMLQCWKAEPTDRPDFKDIRLALQKMVEYSKESDYFVPQASSTYGNLKDAPFRSSTSNQAVNLHYAEGISFPDYENQGYEIPIPKCPPSEKSNPALDAPGSTECLSPAVMTLTLSSLGSGQGSLQGFPQGILEKDEGLGDDLHCEDYAESKLSSTNCNGSKALQQALAYDSLSEGRSSSDSAAAYDGNSLDFEPERNYPPSSKR